MIDRKDFLDIPEYNGISAIRTTVDYDDYPGDVNMNFSINIGRNQILIEFYVDGDNDVESQVAQHLKQISIIEEHIDLIKNQLKNCPEILLKIKDAGGR